MTWPRTIHSVSYDWSPIQGDHLGQSPRVWDFGPKLSSLHGSPSEMIWEGIDNWTSKILTKFNWHSLNIIEDGRLHGPPCLFIFYSPIPGVFWGFSSTLGFMVELHFFWWYSEGISIPSILGFGPKIFDSMATKSDYFRSRSRISLHVIFHLRWYSRNAN